MFIILLFICVSEFTAFVQGNVCTKLTNLCKDGLLKKMWVSIKLRINFGNNLADNQALFYIRQ